MAADRPSFRGLSVYRNLAHRFSLLYSQEWTCEQLPRSAGGGVLFFPDPTDRATYLLVQSRRLRVRARTVDLDVLRAGLLEGLRSLPQANIEQVDASTTEPLIDLEAQYTFGERGTSRRRWIRLLYQGNLQVSLTAQGASDAAFAYWRPMFNTAMRSVRFGDWWAEMTGTSWRHTLDDRASDDS